MKVPVKRWRKVKNRRRTNAQYCWLAKMKNSRIFYEAALKKLPCPYTRVKERCDSVIMDDIDS